MFRPLIALACTAAALTAVPAHATPYAGQYDYLTTDDVSIVGADGAQWVLSFEATQGAAAESRSERFLTIDLRRCAVNTCVSRGAWVQPLAAGQVDVKPAVSADSPGLTSTGHVETTVAGKPFVVSLAGDSISGSRFEFVPGGVDYRPHVTNFSYASGTVRLGPLTCKTAEYKADIGQFTGADTIGNDARTPRTPTPSALPTGFLTGKHKPHC